jgi:pyruvate, orthophosphate dikinase
MNEYYSFNSSEYINDPEVLDVLGIRGKRIMELASIGASTLPGFMVSNDTINNLSENTEETADFLREPIEKVTSILGKKFNDASNPLLFKIVESPLLNMIRGFSIHNIGLCEKTIEGFGTFVGIDFAYHEFRGVFRKLIELEKKTEISGPRENELLDIEKQLKAAKTTQKIKAIIPKLKKVYPEEIFVDSYHQIVFVLELLKSFFSNSSSNVDSSVLIQAMTFGNYGEESFFGSYYSRDIITGKNEISGNFFMNSFDSTQSAGKPIGKIDASIRKDLIKIAGALEKKFKEIRQVRFTVESGKLWIIDQISVPNKSTQAEIQTLLDLHKKGIVDDKYLINIIKPGRLSEILHPVLNVATSSKMPQVTGGIAGAVGAAVGRVYFSTDKLIKAYKVAIQSNQDTNVILVMPSTYAEDVKAIEVARGVLARDGGYASHAPVVARSLGKVAMVYPKIEFLKDSVKIGKKIIKEGDYLSLNVPYYEPPVIIFGKVDLIEPSPEGSGLLEYLDIVQKYIYDFDVHANGDQPKDAELAKLFKAKGIGLCRTEHMFFHKDRINIFRTLIIAGDRSEREKALLQLKKFQVSDFYNLLKIMANLPVTIRLLDAPLHEFLPHTRENMQDFVSYAKKKYPKLSETEIRARCDLLKEVNPMLGHRGVRVAISYPEIYNMQVRALFEAAYKLKKEGIKACPEIMIPIVMSAIELKTIRNGKKIEGKVITGIRDIEREVREKFGATPIEYKVGTMIELPAAALQADRIARYADFFSFGTNDLTQTTTGLSRDDFNTFFSDYSEFDLLEANPFKILGEQVKELIAIAAVRGRLTRPDLTMGICGEHGAEPENIPFVRDLGLNYVSCSPYGIPIAKLVIAKLNIKDAEKTS